MSESMGSRLRHLTSSHFGIDQPNRTYVHCYLTVTRGHRIDTLSLVKPVQRTEVMWYVRNPNRRIKQPFDRRMSIKHKC
jgi:hypothetical protein